MGNPETEHNTTNTIHRNIRTIFMFVETLRKIKRTTLAQPTKKRRRNRTTTHYFYNNRTKNRMHPRDLKRQRETPTCPLLSRFKAHSLHPPPERQAKLFWAK